MSYKSRDRAILNEKFQTLMRPNISCKIEVYFSILATILNSPKQHNFRHDIYHLKTINSVNRFLYVECIHV